MKSCISILLFLFATQMLLSQHTLRGRIVDSNSGVPVDYVNIGIINQAIGTVSQENGSFLLQFEASDLNDKDIVQFSRIGYETLRFSLESLLTKLEEDPNIVMKEVLYELEEIIVSNIDAKKNRIGYISTSQSLFGFWNDSLALGGEHASKIRIKKSPLKLEDLSFNIITSISDSLLVRVNLYEIEKGLPGKNISNRNILHTITRKRGRVTIDLSPYNIVVKDHFIVSLELLKIYGGEVGIAISASDDGLRSYTRLLSQDRWRRVRRGTTIAFNLNTSAVDVKDNALLATSKDENREKPEKVTLFWDNSYSMVDRNLEKELLFLDNYFKYLGDITVELKTFGYESGISKDYIVEKGNWQSLRKDLKEIRYDGATSLDVLFQLKIPEHTSLLFTDAKGFPENINADWRGTVFTINSKQHANHSMLKSIAEDSEANYINLNKIDDIRLATDYTKKYLVDNLEYGPSNSEYQGVREIRGNVSDFDYPLSNVTVNVSDGNEKVRTNKDGNFLIEAKTGDVLEFSYPGREKVTVFVNSGMSKLNITMPLGVKILDEVVVEGNYIGNLKEESKSEKQKITTNFGAIDPKRTGFAIKQIDGDKISNANRDIATAIIGKVPGVRVFGNGSNARIALRGNELQDLYAAWDVDGLLYPPDRPPIHIDSDNVKSVTIMPGAWAAARYGLMATGGVIIVKTISQSFDTVPVKNTGVVDQARLRNNVYKGDAVPLNVKEDHQPKYIQWLSGEKNLDEAYSSYFAQRKLYGNQPHFYADVYSFFINRWGEGEIAHKILSTIEEQFSEDISALRLLAYTLEKEKYYKRASAIYKKIYALKPSQAQNQRDLANINLKLGEVKEAWSIYNNYLLGIHQDLDNHGIDRIIKDEAINLIKENHSELQIDTTQFSLDQDKYDITMVFEWNNPNAEFDIQFVNPENRYYIWHHTKEENKALFADELVKGYSSDVFQIDDLAEGNGQWLVNVKYHGNQENTPSYLKITIKDGRNGSEKVKVFKLQDKGVNYNFLSFNSSGMKSTLKTYRDQ